MTNCFAALPKTLRKLNWLIIATGSVRVRERERETSGQENKNRLAFLNNSTKKCSNHAPHTISSETVFRTKLKANFRRVFYLILPFLLLLRFSIWSNAILFFPSVFFMLLVLFFSKHSTANRWCFWWIVEILQNHLACANPMHEHQENHHHQRIFTQTTEFLPIFFPPISNLTNRNMFAFCRHVIFRFYANILDMNFNRNRTNRNNILYSVR